MVRGVTSPLLKANLESSTGILATPNCHPNIILEDQACKDRPDQMLIQNPLVQFQRKTIIDKALSKPYLYAQ